MGQEAGDSTPLAEYLNALRGARLLLIGGPLLAALVALALGMWAAPQFEATATLLVSQSKIGEQIGPSVDVRNYRAFVENQSLAAAIVQQFGLDAVPHDLTPATFLRSNVSLNEVRATNLLELRVRLMDPKVAADVANALADRAVALSRSLDQEETVVAREIIKDQLDGARERLTQTRQAREQYQQEAQVDLLQKQMDVLVEQQADVQKLLVDIAGERAHLAKAEEELAKQDRVRNVQRSIQAPAPQNQTQPRSNPQNQAQPGSNEPVRPSFRDELLDPYINPVYETLQHDVSTTRAKLAALEHQRDELLRARSRDGQLPPLNELYRRKTRLGELEMQEKLAEKIYVDVATRYEQARLQVAGRSAQLQVVDRALVPETQVSPRIVVNVPAAVVLTFSAIATLIVSIVAVRRAIRPVPIKP